MHLYLNIHIFVKLQSSVVNAVPESTFQSKLLPLH